MIERQRIPKRFIQRTLTLFRFADKWHFLKNLLDVVKETISSRFPKGWFIIPESSVIETTDNKTDIATTNEESTVSHESLSEKEQSKWTLILEVQKSINN